MPGRLCEPLTAGKGTGLSKSIAQSKSRRFCSLLGSMPAERLASATRAKLRAEIVHAVNCRHFWFT
jgi:hypothetical protein